jgi:hypothetical protein
MEEFDSGIEKLKNIIADSQRKLRELEQKKVKYKDDKVAAMFRNEDLSEDDFAAINELLRLRREKENNITPLNEIKEEETDDFDKT